MKMALVAGTRGGSGKTVCSHLLALGAYKEGVPAVLINTDTTRDPAAANLKRPYNIVDGVNPENPSDAEYLKAMINAYYERYKSTKSLLIIDGCASRHAVDIWLSDAVDVTVLPALVERASSSAINKVWEDYKKTKSVKAIVLNRMPQANHLNEHHEAIIESLPVKPVLKLPNINKVWTLDSDVYYNDSDVNRIARVLFLCVAQKAGMYSLDESRARIEAITNKSV